MNATTATDDLLADPQPSVRHLELNGVPCVAVGLSGVHGFGREMLLDLDTWNDISTTITPHWSVTVIAGKSYVYSGCNVAAEIVGRTSKSRMLLLARHLSHAAPNMMTRFRNGNRLDMTRANLVVVDRSTHSRLNAHAGRQNTLRREPSKAAGMAAAG